LRQRFDSSDVAGDCGKIVRITVWTAPSTHDEMAGLIEGRRKVRETESDVNARIHRFLDQFPKRTRWIRDVRRAHRINPPMTLTASRNQKKLVRAPP